ncbi:methyltransferase [Paraglaciecola aquimarina]|uniref:Methyltransferase n=1 Tax=Paraglaciecola aquimarina TaxID=1235557 RepID=A0ABU3SUI0_9ALTE|nr:methyltransferase [Paraglaciecola aquimarina]MDU0353676.1 methyltransferase [Paraglaciecola aquimarina]
MFKRTLKSVLTISTLTFTLLSSSTAMADAISEAVGNEHRPAEHRLRDEYRHPQQTLRFFDIQPDMSVAEISPGGGWYSHILAPLLKDSGTYYAAHFYVYDGAPGYFERSLGGFKKKVASTPSLENTKITAFHQTKALDFAPAGTLDRVLTFRNVHNWYMQGGQEGIDNAFSSFYKALKKGGVLGVVEHKLPESYADSAQSKSGYMKQSFVVAAAEKAGFKLVAENPVNLNALDTADHEKGVWTLPPSLRLGEKDQAKYLAIGESSRMTLKFVKP